MKRNDVNPIFNMPPLQMQLLAAKLKQMMGGDTPSPTPKTLDDYVYYSGKDTEMDITDPTAVATEVLTWTGKTKKYTTTGIAFNNVYEYFAIPSKYTIDKLEAENEFHEDVTEYATKVLSAYQQDGKSYDLWQFVIEPSHLPLQETVTLKVK